MEIKNNLTVVVDQWKINGVPIKSVSDFSQDGASTWLTIGATYQNDKVFISLSTPACIGDCELAKLPANSIKDITLKYNFNGQIITSNVNDVYIGNPAPVFPGNVNITVDYSRINRFLNNSGNVTINILNNSTRSVSNSFSFNPSSEKGNFSTIIYGLPPNQYLLDVNKTTLPNVTNGTIGYNITPRLGFSVISNQTSNASITFTFVPPAQVGSIVFNLTSLPLKDTINGTVFNSFMNISVPISFNSSQMWTVVNNLPVNVTYQVYLPGLAYPSLRTYLAPVNLTTPQVVYQKYIYVNISYGNPVTSGLYNITVNTTGYTDNQPVPISFTSNLARYIYYESNLLFNQPQVYQFPLDEQVRISVRAPSSWSALVTPEIVTSNVKQINIQFSKSSENLLIGGYYQSWSANWASSGKDLSLSKIPSYVSRILISFASPSMSYKKGSKSLGGTGLQFSSDYDVVKSAIAIAKQNNPNQKFLLSVGGATYPWNTPNYNAMVDFVNDLDLDGIDIDYENIPSCSGVDTVNLKCNTDEQLTQIIDNLRALLPSGKLLTAAVFSVGAFGTTTFPNSKFGPSSNYAGMWVNPLKRSGFKLDEIFIMSYDASPAYSQTDGFNSYQSIFSNKIHIGLEVPPEAWGGYILTVPDAMKFATHVKNNKGHGVFIWSLEKVSGGVNANTFIEPICNLFGYSNCSQKIPLN